MFGFWNSRVDYSSFGLYRNFTENFDISAFASIEILNVSQL